MSVKGCHCDLVAMIMLAGLSIWDCTSGSCLAAKRVKSSSWPAVSRRNATILSAASAFEDLIESALNGQKAMMHKALAAYNEQGARISEVLSPRKRRDIALLVVAIRKAEEQKDNLNVALSSVEAYRALIESLDASGLRVPVQVSLLDYAGFKLKVLLRAKTPDWPALGKIADEAHRHWKAIASRVSDKALRDTVDTMITGMSGATRAKNAEMAAFVAQIDLALVDLLEGYWSKGRVSKRDASPQQPGILSKSVTEGP